MPEDRNNTIFAPSATQSLPSAKTKLDLEIETINVRLPSCGLLYDSESLKNKEFVEIVPMMTKQENILRNQTLIKNNTAITEMIKSALVDRKIDFNSMVAGDRNALLFQLRISGYGDSYEPKVTCPKCGKEQNLVGFKISEGIAMKLFDEAKVNRVGVNQFQFFLPGIKKTIEFKFWTGRDEDELAELQKERKKRGLQDDSSVSQRLAQQIVSIDGITDKITIEKFCQHMFATDSLAFRKYVSEVEPGVELKTFFACVDEECGYTKDGFNVPLTPAFFWPELADKI
jgi:hypothetical protein